MSKEALGQPIGQAPIHPLETDARSGYADLPIIPRLILEHDIVRQETIRHHLNRYSLATTYVQSGRTIAVDICSGTGYGTDMLQRAGAKLAIGVDLSFEGIDYSRTNYPKSNFFLEDATHFLSATIKSKQIPRPDLVTFFEAIEHLEKPTGLAILDSVRDIIQPSGTFLISTPRDIRADVNPNHISQWTFDELKSSLSLRFSKVEMLGQDWQSGEFTTTDPHEASFFVAICSTPIHNAVHEKTIFSSRV